MKKNNHKSAFSVVEIIIIIAVGLILFTITTSAFNGMRNRQALNATIEEISSAIQNSQAKTLASKKSQNYGVRFEANRLVAFEGSTFTEPNTANKEIKFSSLAEISVISLNGGGQNMVFEKLTGETNQYGAITVRIKNDTAGIKTITIEKTGSVSIQ